MRDETMGMFTFFYDYEVDIVVVVRYSFFWDRGTV